MSRPTPAQRSREYAARKARAKIHPVTCDCGWTNNPQHTQGRAAYLVRRHQGRANCGGTPPPPIRPRCTDCARRYADHDDGRCTDCHRAELDHESPLALEGGRWVAVAGVRKWVEAA